MDTNRRPSGEEVLKLNAELEQRVAERTAELASINEKLRAEIVERTRVETELRYHAYLLENVQDAIIATDEKFAVTSWNSAAEAIYGWTAEEAMGKIVQDLLRSEFTDAERTEALRSLHDAGRFHTEVLQHKRDGKPIWVEGLVMALRDSTGEVNGFVTVNRDVTERKQAEETLRQREFDLAEAQRVARLGSWRLDINTNTIRWSEELYRIFDVEKAAFDGTYASFLSRIHPDDRTRVLQVNAEARSNGEPFEVEYRVTKGNGQLKHIREAGYARKDHAGSVSGLFGTAQDITERKQVEEEIHRHATRMEALAEISQALAEVGLDVQAVFETIVRHTAELIGDTCSIRLLSSDEQWLKSVTFHHPNPEVKALMKVLHPTTPTSATNSWLTPVLRTGQPLLIPIITQEQFRRSVQPEYLPFFQQVGLHSMLIVPLRVKDRVIGTLGLSRDQPGHPYTSDDQVLLQDLADRASLTIQNAQLFEQVQGAHARQESLSRRILEVQEAERRALTIELHDRVGQNLTGLGINLQNMKAMLSSETAKTLATKFDDAQVLVEHITRQIRDIMAELHLPELEDYGLAVALETYAERAASRGNLELIADLTELALPPPEVSTALFRAAQEAISNVLKHANATQLEVTLEERDGKILLRVEDNGRGFEQDSASPKEAPTWGLKIMRERIEAIGGEVRIQSEMKVGTRVTFEIGKSS